MLRELFGTCSVHRVALVEGEAPIAYGLIRFDRAYLKARKRLFPNSRSFVLGGCVVSLEDRKAAVRYCPRCREAERAWNEASPGRK